MSVYPDLEQVIDVIWLTPVQPFPVRVISEGKVIVKMSPFKIRMVEEVKEIV